MELPSTKSPPLTKDPRILILYGAPKVGKTTELAKLPDCLIVDCEDGTDYVEALRIKCRTLEEVEAVATELRKRVKESGKPAYKYVALDTVSTLEDWCEVRATQNYKNSTIGKNFTGDSVLTLPQGGGYLYLRLALTEILGQFSGTTSRLIIVGHLRDKFLEKGGVESTYKDLELTGKLRSIVCSKADAIGYLYRDPKDSNGALKVSFQTLEGIIAGSRCEHLRGKILPFDWNTIYSEGL
jgi:Cdc6-like AAA superfamily ATPase